MLIQRSHNNDFTYDEDAVYQNADVDHENNGKLCDKATSILFNGPNDADKTTAETWADKRGNVLEVKVNGVTQMTNTYNEDDSLATSVDEITGSQTNCEYNPSTKRTLRAEKTAGTDVAAIAEDYVYNEYGQVQERSVTGAVDQSYSYVYKDNVEKELDYVALPNGLRSKVETDVNGRAKELLLQDANGENRFGTYLYYRKHGNRTTNMVSSVRYGGVKNGKYAIGEGQKYKYNAAGNISEVFESGILVIRYTYDSLSRLIREDNRNVGTFLFNYDNNGNILTRIETKFTTKPTDEITDFTKIVSYEYDGTQGDRLISLNGAGISYDQIGNPTNYLGTTLIWEKGRQLKRFGSTNFTYDGSGKRIKKNSTVFTYAPNGDLVKLSDGTNPNTLEFIYDGSGVAGFKRNNTNYIYRKNISGDVTHILDISGNVVVEYTYDACGRHATRAQNNSGSLVASVTGTDTTFTNNMALANANPFRYRGYYYDTETQLYFLKTRYYDPAVGRFINADAVSYLDPETINGLNLYAYCGNNPVMYL